jgi:hypothetical protein
VQDDRVHRDLYLSEEMFALEQERLFANTWVFLGHASQVPEAGDFVTQDIAGRPLLMVRQPDGSLRVHVQPLRAQGHAAGHQTQRQHRPHLPLPVPLVDLPLDGSPLGQPMKAATRARASRPANRAGAWRC